MAKENEEGRSDFVKNAQAQLNFAKEMLEDSAGSGLPSDHIYYHLIAERAYQAEDFLNTGVREGAFGFDEVGEEFSKAGRVYDSLRKRGFDVDEWMHEHKEELDKAKKLQG